MDDQFFAKLREIQRKERANSSLARVESDFYIRTHKYLDSIREVAREDPFSDENDLLKIVQRIATEICEMREHKIASSAMMNIHRSYHLFQGKPQFDLVDTTPLNITEEEETLYFSFIDVLKNHRRNIYLDQLTTNNTTDDDNKTDDNIANNNTTDGNVSDNNINNNIGENEGNGNDKVDKSRLKEDQILNRLNNIKSAKVIEDETHEPIEKQITKLKYPENNVSSNEQENKQIKSQPPISSNLKDNKNTNIENNTNSTDFDNNTNSADFDNNTNSTKTNNVKTNSIKNNSAIKPESEVSNVVIDENEQFVDLDHLNQDIPHNPEYDSSSRANSKSTVDKIANVMILIFSEINSIIGVDKKVYGPFKPQDIVIMPDVNAEILIKNKKGRLINA